jgi:predicted PurR-regulated permease PerM
VDALIQDLQQSVAAGTQPLETSTSEGVQSVAVSVAQALAGFAIDLGSSIPNMITQGIIFIVVVATVLPVYDTLMPKLEEISPLGDELSQIYNRKITAMVKSLVLGVFLIAILQGLAMGIVYWIAGLPYIFLFTLLSMLLAMIPMVGISWLVIAIAIVSFLTGNWQQGVIVLVGFYGVVNWIDILLRPKLLVEEASINFGLFLVSIFAGLAWAGAMGLFYGPVIMLLLVTTIQIYAERYANEDVDYLGKAFNKLGGDGEADASASDAPEAEAGAEGKDSGAWPEPETSQEPDPEEPAEPDAPQEPAPEEPALPPDEGNP